MHPRIREIVDQSFLLRKTVTEVSSLLPAADVAFAFPAWLLPRLIAMPSGHAPHCGSGSWAKRSDWRRMAGSAGVALRDLADHSKASWRRPRANCNSAMVSR